MILYVNACVRKESRTKRLADRLLEKLNGTVEEVRLDSISFPTVDRDFLIHRDELIAAGDFDNPLFALARQFAASDVIVVAAPYYDLSFPASLKQYLEQINVVGITFRYSEAGVPVPLCKAKRLYYVTTAGGNCVPDEFGFGYVKALAEGYYGIKDVELIKAVGLDMDGADVEGIMKEAEDRI
ncbi:MAG: NAD(P)H-dependent oxidoreductase [Lachnospiraceae bacterium]|nr:NAD(P)H-dependent oxidoreductase [Lachnospiraceae bacterium]